MNNLWAKRLINYGLKGLIILFVALISYADTLTTRTGLTKPANNSKNWDIPLNANFDLIDSTFAALGQTNTFTGTNTFSGLLNVGYVSSTVGAYPAGYGSIAYGPSALHSFRQTGYVGRPNIAIGLDALYYFIDGGNTVQTGGNTAVGYSACASTGNYNTCFGDFAGAYNVDGINNIFIGAIAGDGQGGASTSFHGNDQIYIGSNFSGPDGGANVNLSNAGCIGPGCVVNSSNSFVLGCQDTTVNSTHATCPGSYTSYNVGIATDTPKERLHVAGNLRIDSGFLQLTSQTSAQIKAATPKAVGEYYYCSNCTTVTTCVSTGTVVGAWSLITNKTGACQ